MENNLWAGRKYEIETLLALHKKNKSQLIALYGKRDVGKTSLIEHVFQDERVWKFEGLKAQSEDKQIEYFMYNLATYTGKYKLLEKKVSTWKKAFALLEDEIRNQKVIVFFNKLEWLSNKRDSFISTFKRSWDRIFKSHKRIRLILCGSDISFMTNKVIHSRALEGQIDAEISLNPLSLGECEDLFLQKAGIKKSNKKTKEETFDTAMVLGGVPKYWQQLKPAQNLEKNLDQMAFHHSGSLFQDYRKNMFADFGSNSTEERILMHLSEGPSTVARIAEILGVQSGGSLSGWLEGLEQQGLIEKYYPLDKGSASNILRYRIADPVTHFYGRVMYPHAAEIAEGDFSLRKAEKKESYQAWQNEAFERICISQAPAIADALGLSNVDYASGSWFRREKKPQKSKSKKSKAIQNLSAQFSLLFERADEALTVCEFHYTLPKSTKQLIEQFEQTLVPVREAYDNFIIHKVLVLAHKQTIPPNIQKHFNRILFATEVF